MAVPTTTMHLTSGFASYEEFKNNVRDRIIQRTSDGSGLDIVYHDIHPDWAKDVIHFVDDNLERYGSRKNYNSFTRVFWMRIMPTPIHNCHHDWYRLAEHGWAASGLMTVQELEYLETDVARTIELTGYPYRGSLKEPDFLVRPEHSPLPSVVIESGWSESFSRLMDDMNLWLCGGNRVCGVAELYTNDANEIPTLLQSAIIFPRPDAGTGTNSFILTRAQLFADRIHPGRLRTDQFMLSIDGLRRTAMRALGLMNLVPA